MSAQVYPAQVYNRMPPVPPSGPSSRRYPFTNAAVNHPRPQGSPPKPQEKPKQPPSPPLPRQNSKTTPPSPPKVISDKSGKLQFHRIGFLGEVSYPHQFISISKIKPHSREDLPVCTKLKMFVVQDSPAKLSPKARLRPRRLKQKYSCSAGALFFH